MLDKEFGYYHFVISKEEIDRFEFNNILSALHKIHLEPRRYFNKIIISIYGYEKDSRELYEIKEVRQYLDFLDKSFPYWFYYARKDILRNASLFSLMITSICKYHRLDSGMIEIDNDSLIKFLINHYSFMNELMVKVGHSEKEIKETLMLIDKIIYR